MSDFQERLDKLLEDLDLTLPERDWLYSHRKTDRCARRVVNLLGEAAEATGMDAKRAVLEHLFAALKEARVKMAASHFVPPVGHEVVPESALEAFRSLAVLQLRLTDMGSTDPDRAAVLRKMVDVARTAAILDPEVEVLMEALA